MNPAAQTDSSIVEDLRNKLKLKSLVTKKDFDDKFADFNKSLKDRNVSLTGLRDHSAKLLTAGALASTLLLSPPLDSTKLVPRSPSDILASINDKNGLPSVSPATKLREAMKEILPETIRPLNDQEESYLEKVITEITGIPTKATLEGEHLNTTYGKIGAEQHLIRYPGDTAAAHTPEEGEYGSDRPDDILKEGITPGLGAWGYFASSRDELSEDLVETEKWYSVAQTLYLPDWNTRQPYLKNWYKYRKLLIINTDNGKAVVTALADSGPAAFTGKQFGGSPEVMDYLGGERYKKGPVLVFFVDDPDNEIPLGPVEYNEGAYSLNLSNLIE